MGKTQMSGRILLLNGVNLNTLGTREPEIYGHETLGDVEQKVRDAARGHGLEVDAFQSNNEGEFIDALHGARGKYLGCIMNPGAWTHTSVAIHDAIKASELVVVEVHISNPHQREEFRHTSFVSSVAKAVIAGAGTAGYVYAVDVLATM